MSCVLPPGKSATRHRRVTWRRPWWPEHKDPSDGSLGWAWEQHPTGLPLRESPLSIHRWSHKRQEVKLPAGWPEPICITFLKLPVTTNDHNLFLHHRNVFLHHAGSWKSEIRGVGIAGQRFQRRIFPGLFQPPVPNGLPRLEAVWFQSLPPSSQPSPLWIPSLCVSWKDTCHTVQNPPG